MERRFAATPRWQYRRLDQEHRSRTLSVPTWFPDWHLIRPPDVAQLEELADRPAVAAGLLSMHPNGWVREAAVRALAATDEPRAFPLLLVRCADWVEPVRAAAQSAVRSRLARSRGEDTLLAAPLLRSMANERGRAADFASEVLDVLRTDIDMPVLLAGLTHDAHRVRRESARLLIERREASAAALAIALGQDDVVTACQVGMAALDQAPDPDVILDALWGSSIPTLRATALYRLQSGEAPLARSVSEDALFDRSPSVRFLAQRYLAKHGANVPQRYRDALGTRPTALHGLAEVGVVDDAEAIQHYLDDPVASLRASAIQAVGRLIGAESRSFMLAKLDDPSPGVVRAACRGLARQQLDPVALDQLWEWAASTNDGRSRRRAFGVFLQQSRWPKLLVACRSIASTEDELRSLGELLLRSALDSWNRSFTRPTAAQIDEITRLEPLVSGHSDRVADLLKHAR